MPETIKIAVVDNRVTDAEERVAAINAKPDWPAQVSAEIFTNADDLFEAYDVHGKFFDIVLTDVFMPPRGEDPRQEGSPETGAIRIQEWLRDKRKIDEDFKYVQLRWISRKSDVSSFIHKYINSNNYSWLRWISHHEKSSFLTVDLLMEVERAIRMALPGIGDKEVDSKMVAESAVMKNVLKLASQAAKTDSSVLIIGESGTGKELIAKFIHQNSVRSDHRLVSVNCSALNESLAEAEFFGNVKGAYTGAVAGRQGLFELADHGTLFLDEIGELPLSLQPKILRVLQEGEFSPVGAYGQPTKSNFRVIAASWRDLKATEIFREDLFYRLAVFVIDVPPLRQRPDDIEPLAKFLLKQKAAETKKWPLSLTDEVVDCFKTYTWPGNVRELSNVIERGVGLAAINDVISLEQLPDYLQPNRMAVTPVNPLTDHEQKYFQALKDQNFNISKAADILGMSRSGLQKYINDKNRMGDLRHPMLKRLYDEGKSSVAKRKERANTAAARANPTPVTFLREEEF